MFYGLEEVVKHLNSIQKNMPKYRVGSPEVYGELEKKYKELLQKVERQGTLKMYKEYNMWLDREKILAQQK